MTFKLTLPKVALLYGADSHSVPGKANLPRETSALTSLVVSVTTVFVSQTTERRIYTGSIRKNFK
jgi:hypothetical protein